MGSVAVVVTSCGRYYHFYIHVLQHLAYRSMSSSCQLLSFQLVAQDELRYPRTLDGLDLKENHGQLIVSSWNS